MCQGPVGYLRHALLAILQSPLPALSAPLLAYGEQQFFASVLYLSLLARDLCVLKAQEKKGVPDPA